MTISFPGGNIGSTFAIDTYTGLVTLARNNNLKVAKMPKYSLLVQVKLFTFFSLMCDSAIDVFILTLIYSA